MIYIPFCPSSSLVDTVPPTISDCPDDISDTTELGTMSKAIVWNEATATDASGFVTEHHTHFSGESFFLGLTEVVSNFTDPSGNYAVCTFLVNLTAGRLYSNITNRLPHVNGCHSGQNRTGSVS